MIFITHWGERVELTDAESAIVRTIKAYQYQDRLAIVRALKHFGNADKVLRVLELRNQLATSHGCYTLYSIIARIGERTPEQYVADTDRAVREFYLEYYTAHPEIAVLMGVDVEALKEQTVAR